MMRNASLLMAVLAATGLAACEPVPPAVTPDTPAYACGAAGYQGLIGQPRDVLGPMTFPIGTRVIGPDDPVTADLNPKRLNIEYGRGGRIEKISCY